jgi:ketosteroid isomerase-like protein
VTRDEAVAVLDALHTAQNAFYAGGDDGPLRGLLTPDVVWTIPGASPIAGAYEGVDATLQYMARRRDLAGETFRMHPREVLVGEHEHVAALTDGTATIGGAEHAWSTLGLYRVRAGRIAACRLLAFDQAAFDRVWSAGR